MTPKSGNPSPYKTRIKGGKMEKYKLDKKELSREAVGSNALFQSVKGTHQ